MIIKAGIEEGTYDAEGLHERVVTAKTPKCCGTWISGMVFWRE